ncbi:hypothetical protein D6833_12145 [Candidatus Parcubacteria bacterium]|nr:MAG: hypothetical protein D6833_12145 [Candidatus Parcubacteria bacterium]
MLLIVLLALAVAASVAVLIFRGVMIVRTPHESAPKSHSGVVAPNQNSNPSPNPNAGAGSTRPENLTSCVTDSDCVVVPYEGCCEQFRAINTRYKKAYLKNGWQKMTPQEAELCTRVECSPQFRGEPAAACVQGSCVLREQGK